MWRPGFLSPSAGLKFADIPNGLAAVSKVPVAGWAQIAAYFGFVEFSGGFDDYKTGTPGDYGFKVLTSSDPEEKTKKLSAELANGRLAMMAIIGMFFQDSTKQVEFKPHRIDNTIAPCRCERPGFATLFSLNEQRCALKVSTRPGCRPQTNLVFFRISAFSFTFIVWLGKGDKEIIFRFF